jgi:hydroxymethylpyrimidine/phosphomethylpyrimidine kinase
MKRSAFAHRSRQRGGLKPALPVLTIAGSDSGAGAGVQADARTIHALGGFACMAITAVTAQNTRGVRTWRAEPPALLAAQLEAVLSDLPIAAIKTGLLPGAAAVRVVARALANFPRLPLVVDPVIGSTSGTRFLDAAGLRMLRRDLLPRATLVTPNWPELSALTGAALPDYSAAEAAAQALARAAGCAVLVKGGHAPDRKFSRDCLVTREGRVRWFSSPRIVTRNTHGTGCVLSAAIATRLACGDELERAIVSARTFLQRSLRANRRANWGGAGPAFPG